MSDYYWGPTFEDHPECSPLKPGADEFELLDSPSDALLWPVECVEEGCTVETVHPSEVCGVHRDE